ncbi:hypothetical protein [Bacillus cereus group sp. RP43]|uniref:hypothetical protein n=1 Tax=Bacillus cereus group sp. RP43 TaxID=3040260 RepID=UPI0033998270
MKTEMMPARLGEIQDSLLYYKKAFLKTDWSSQYILLEGLTEKYKLNLMKKGVSI